MIRRRDFIKTAGLGTLGLSYDCKQFLWEASGETVNDIHSQLNATRVRRVVKVDSLGALEEAVDQARLERVPLSIGGGRHAMGGQQFGTDTIHLDTRSLNRILNFDTEKGLIEVEAGIQWPELMDEYLGRQEGLEEPWASPRNRREPTVSASAGQWRQTPTAGVSCSSRWSKTSSRSN